MNYPRKWVKVGKCLAPVMKISGPRRQEGPVSKGRVCVHYKGESWKAGRLSYHLNKGKLPRTPKTLKRGIVCHHCDNPWCIRPSHLYLGTAKQNTKDIFDRNPFIRQRMSAKLLGNTRRRGKTMSLEARRKLSKALMGNSNKLGKKESLETRMKKSASAKRRGQNGH